MKENEGELRREKGRGRETKEKGERDEGKQRTKEKLGVKEILRKRRTEE